MKKKMKVVSKNARVIINQLNEPPHEVLMKNRKRNL